jgi:hypothetical protein
MTGDEDDDLFEQSVEVDDPELELVLELGVDPLDLAVDGREG